MLVVGGSARLLASCAIAARAFATVEAVEFISMASVTRLLRPSAIVMTEAVYNFDPVGVDALAAAAVTTVVTVEREGIRESILFAAVNKTKRLRGTNS